VTVDKDEYRPRQPIVFREAKLRKGLKKKGSRLWVIKELKNDGTIELEGQLENMLTKGLNKNNFERIISKLGMENTYSLA